MTFGRLAGTQIAQDFGGGVSIQARQMARRCTLTIALGLYDERQSTYARWRT